MRKEDFVRLLLNLFKEKYYYIKVINNASFKVGHDYRIFTAQINVLSFNHGRKFEIKIKNIQTNLITTLTVHMVYNNGKIIPQLQ